MQRNIILLKVIFSLNVAWFWLGIWVPYYLLFTDYAGVGVIETVVVVTIFLLELPTGAFADMLGKKRTLLLVFLFNCLGNIVMASADHFSQILLAIILLGIGTSFFSGTSDAMIYDSLLALKREKQYERVLSVIQTYGLITMAVASAIGGWMYLISPSLPFWGVAVVHGICGVLTFWLVEPPLDSVRFSLNSYVAQMLRGVGQLFAVRNELKWLLKLLIIGAFAKYLIEGLDPAIGLAFGLSEVELGYVYALVPLISAAGAYFYGKSKGKDRGIWWNLIVFTLIIGPLLSPVIGLFMGVGVLLLRNVFYPILETMTSNTVNRLVDSKYRATTLSAFNMLVSTPYVLGAAIIGSMIDTYGALWVVSVLSCFFLLLYVVAPRAFPKFGLKATNKLRKV